VKLLKFTVLQKYARYCRHLNKNCDVLVMKRAMKLINYYSGAFCLLMRIGWQTRALMMEFIKGSFNIT
jgi:hypothetical protein